jgi:hypothetical protein
MPVVTFDYNEFLDLLGYQIPKDKLIEKLTYRETTDDRR